MSSPNYITITDWRIPPWEQTPRWHPYYWFGWTFRRWYNQQFDVYWEYGRPQRVARDVLEALYDA